MRKIVYGVGTSLDGYVARLDGSLDLLYLRPSNYSMSPFFKTIDVGLMGRKTYEAGVRMSGGKFQIMACAATFSPGRCRRGTRRGYSCARGAKDNRGRVAQKRFTPCCLSNEERGVFGITRIGMHRREHMLILRPTRDCFEHAPMRIVVLSTISKVCAAERLLRTV